MASRNLTVIVVLGVVAVIGVVVWATWPAAKSGVSQEAARTLDPAASIKEETAVPEVTPLPSEPAQDEAAVPKGPTPLDCRQRSAIAAHVDARTISVGELCDALEAMAGPGAGADTKLRARFGADLLARMIDDVLVRQALVAAKLEVSPATVDAEVARLVAERGRGASETRVASVAGVAGDVIKGAVAARLARAALINARTPEPPSAAEIEAAYNASPNLWAKPASALVEGYVARVASGAAAAAHDAARAAIGTVAAMLAKGVSAPRPPGVEPLARFELEQNGLDPELERAVFGAKTGSWSEVVRTKVGWVVVRVIEMRPAVPRPLAEVEPQVRNAVQLRRDRASEDAILAGLRSAAKVSVDVTW